MSGSQGQPSSKLALNTADPKVAFNQIRLSRHRGLCPRQPKSQTPDNQTPDNQTPDKRPLSDRRFKLVRVWKLLENLTGVKGLLDLLVNQHSPILEPDNPLAMLGNVLLVSDDHHRFALPIQILEEGHDIFTRT